MRAIQRNPSSALGVQEVRQLIREVEWRFGDLAREAQAILPLGRLADLMAALARERVPLADFSGLLQAVVTHGPGAPDTHTLYEAMRLSLARGIVASLLPRQLHVQMNQLAEYSDEQLAQLRALLEARTAIAEAHRELKKAPKKQV